ncbi:hypothetical protein MASR2M78_35430 [Treponema sp.]
MSKWILSYKRGLRLLSDHKPLEASREFRQAAERCPSTKRQDLARILYYFGLSLERSGQASLAVKSWVNARKLVRTGAVAHAFNRWVNEYGMRRQGKSELDDYFAFRSIQVRRYLDSRGSGRYGSRAEKDAVNDLILDAWRILSRSGILCGLSVQRKLELFKRSRVDLPFLYVEDALDQRKEIIVGNFRRARLGNAILSSEDRCSCGSGLPSRACCGRLSSCVEMEYGSL